MKSLIKLMLVAGIVFLQTCSVIAKEESKKQAQKTAGHQQKKK